jgi:hypothetical protein
MNQPVAGICFPDSEVARAADKLVRCTEPAWMYHHLVRCYLFGALAGRQEGLSCNLEMLYVAALLHNVGLQEPYRHSHERFEIDSANAARSLLRAHGVCEMDVADVWEAIAVHTTPGLAQHKSALVAMLYAGVQMEVWGFRYAAFTAEERDAVVQAFPRQPGFKSGIIEAYAIGMQDRSETTFGTVNADVLDRWDPGYRRINYCGLILGSPWAE